MTVHRPEVAPPASQWNKVRFRAIHPGGGDGEGREWAVNPHASASESPTGQKKMWGVDHEDQ
jgi:hypothetical protein